MDNKTKENMDYFTVPTLKEKTKGPSLTPLSQFSSKFPFLSLVIFTYVLISLLSPFSHSLAEDNNIEGSVNYSCNSSSFDCLYQSLGQRNCVGTNGFFSQINILSIVNRDIQPHAFLIEYIDSAGKTVTSLNTNIESSRKLDLIINDLVSIDDQIGSVCISTSAPGSKWGGGNTIYKVKSKQPFGATFDFALHYPFQPPRTGSVSMPLNTYHLGSGPKGTVANWISITDSNRDGAPLHGFIRFINDQGGVISESPVTIPDGGRIDIPAHEGIAGTENLDAVGLFEFNPFSETQDELENPYYVTNTRYFYACPASQCNDFRAAMVVPLRPAFSGATFGGVSTLDGFLTVVELNNIGQSTGNAELDVFNGSGMPTGTIYQPLAEKMTRHIVVNKNFALGLLSSESVGSAMMKPSNAEAKISAISFFYKLDNFGRLVNAFAAPFSGPGGNSQISEFNSFIGQSNIAEVFNPSLSNLDFTLTYLDYLGVPVFKTSASLLPFGSIRIPAQTLPHNTLGTILLESDSSSLVFRNYVEKPNEYTLPFIGAPR
ncbi:MAG TPA: hypothetical protein PKA63_13320 [Oligoflexia bacterium]|nr:hypothetical protein [Oligoflexia bacterium]